MVENVFLILLLICSLIILFNVIYDFYIGIKTKDYETLLISCGINLFLAVMLILVTAATLMLINYI